MGSGPAERAPIKKREGLSGLVRGRVRKLGVQAVELSLEFRDTFLLRRIGIEAIQFARVLHQIKHPPLLLLPETDHVVRGGPHAHGHRGPKAHLLGPYPYPGRSDPRVDSWEKVTEDID
jgi:hypothetical protein